MYITDINLQNEFFEIVITELDKWSCKRWTVLFSSRFHSIAIFSQFCYI